MKRLVVLSFVLGCSLRPWPLKPSSPSLEPRKDLMGWFGIRRCRRPWHLAQAGNLAPVIRRCHRRSAT